ncbi:unnamed protein product [Parnassius apollo]|uniref:(apollo) hypothetical protein n=1 Tax=Parnassius apollo TaxID=110799 RepID=A0A8S3XR26_PARAO|nr:unnamed protein product [Parnassius apollo]
MNKVYDVLGSKKCSGLPAFHALTGCDFKPEFYRKEKRKPWEQYSANEDFQELSSHCKAQIATITKVHLPRWRTLYAKSPKESGANNEEVISMYPNFDDEEDDELNNDDDSDCQSDISYTTSP